MILILIIIMILCLLYRLEKYTPIHKYLNKDDLIKLLIKNTDGYYNTFNENDYKVRNIKTIDEYYNIIRDSCVSIDEEQMEKLDTIINNINKKIVNYNIIGFDGNEAANIPWTLGFIDGHKYENGYPHTRENVIIIPISILNSNNLESTLLHEKIHIYQKIYKNDIQDYISNMGLKKYRTREHTDNIRANPDIDNYLYIDNTNNIWKAEYYKNPNNLNDIIIKPVNNIKYEHPFEYMAYEIMKII